MIKIFNITRLIVMAILFLTSIPLLRHYFVGGSLKFEIVNDLHVFSGMLFIVIAIVNIIITKKMKRESNKN
ncbi:MAG: hypothetical protein U9R54_09515 [Bacteroidota bacterium]|nr:hypothetical protein [Bacteroidota bacterium]